MYTHDSGIQFLHFVFCAWSSLLVNFHPLYFHINCKYLWSTGHDLIDLPLFNYLKEDIEEEDCDSIEKVLWHQPKGMAEEALMNNKSTEPVLLSHLFDYESDWNEMEFYIKWKGQSHLHCQWKSFSELQNVRFYFCPHIVMNIFLVLLCIS